MPKIKAYSGFGALIPVTDASVTTAYQCPWTEKLFRRKKDYVDHLKQIRESRMHRKARFLARNRVLQTLWDQPTFDDVINWLESNPKIMLDNLYMRNKTSGDKFWFKVTYLDLRWSESVSNTHDCPHNGVTNWGGRGVDTNGNPYPRGYPGWSGRIEYQTSDHNGFGSDLVKPFRIFTGTGGGCGDNIYGFDVRFFDADWPGIHAYSTLTGQRTNFRYGKPVYFR